MIDHLPKIGWNRTT